MHGSGSRGTNIELIKRNGLLKICKIKKDFKFIIVSPQCLKGEKGRGWWKTSDLNLLLDHIIKTYKVDEDRIYLTGLSMGGFGTWAWAAQNPEKFAAIVPVCGGGKPAKASRYGKIPVWAFHGDKDNRVPYKNSVKMVEAIQKAGGNAKLTTYAGTGHDSWTKTYNNPDLYKWLLKQKKNK